MVWCVIYRECMTLSHVSSIWHSHYILKSPSYVHEQMLLYWPPPFLGDHGSMWLTKINLFWCGHCVHWSHCSKYTGADFIFFSLSIFTSCVSYVQHLVGRWHPLFWRICENRERKQTDPQEKLQKMCLLSLISYHQLPRSLTCLCLSRSHLLPTNIIGNSSLSFTRKICLWNL